jgi:response regulator RpfG family c-di-GMP phosphodiesterase
MDKENIERYYHEIYVTKKAGNLLSCDVKSKSGKTISLEIVASPILDKSGHFVGYRNVGRDVSERKRLERDLLESFNNVQNARTATILGLAKLAEYRDKETGSHLERMREYGFILAQEMAKMKPYREYITPEYINDIYNSAILHDIGKVGIPDAILLKPGKLTPEEFEIIKTHATLGGDALRAIEAQIPGQTFLTLSKEIAYYHHEKWDGSGYPKGLRGEHIPLSARIIALADVYDALTSKRTYKEAFSHEKALNIIVKNRGTHFAPDVVDAFLVHQETFQRIREELHSD